MAASACAHLCARRGIGKVECDSAGLNCGDNDRVHDRAREVLAGRGIPLLRLRSQKVTRKLVARADLVLTMTEAHRRALCSRFRSMSLKILPLTVYGGKGFFGGIPDPYGGTRQTYEDCLDMMMPLLERLLDEVEEGRSC